MRLTQTIQDQVLISKYTNDVKIIDGKRFFTVEDYLTLSNASPWHVDVESLNMALDAEGYKKLDDGGVYIEYEKMYTKCSRRAVIPQSKYEEIIKTGRIDADVLNWCSKKICKIVVDDFMMKARNDVEYYIDNVSNIYSLKCGAPIVFVVIDDKLITADVNQHNSRWVDMCVTEAHNNNPYIIKNIANVDLLSSECEKLKSKDTICIKSDMMEELYQTMMNLYKYHKQNGDIK